MLFIIILTALTGHCVCVDELQVDIDSHVTLVGVNATFNCRVRINRSSGLEIVTDYLDVQWTFSPVGSNNSYIILNSKDNDSFGLVNSNSATQPTNGNKGEDSRSANEIKYRRVVWPHLSILNVEANDAGTYTCRLIDSGLTASAELYVLDELPSCTKNNSGPTYFEDETVTFNCSLSYHGNHPPQLNWEPPDMNVDLTHLTTTHDVTMSQISCGLHVRLQHMIDGKLFTCSAKFVNITNVFTCHDLFPPESVQYKAYINHLKTYPKTDPHNHTIELGSNTTLFCMAHGNPAPTWTWSLKNDKGMMNLPCSHEGCKLTNVTYDNTGTYKCTVSNVIKGQTITSFQVLNLKVIPKGGYPVNLNISQTTPSIVVYADTGISPYAIGAIVCASLAVILILVFILLALKMRTRERNIHQRLTRMHDENLDDQEVELLDENIQPDTADLPIEYGRLKQQWEIARKDIRLVDLIAKGTFVEVWRGRMRKYPRRNDIMKVAIKRIISEATEKERKFFLADLEVMKAIQTHCNVLPLIGCYTASDPWLAMVEFAVEGSLYQYLQHRRPGDLRVEIHTDDRDSVSLKSQNLTAHKLLALAAQVVNGLQHINKFKMIFYRLRAASVLVCKGGVCKLSGFGFIQDITERNLYEMNSAPTRWMSPESLLDNVFNVKTDVWAFGILLWEIVHFGHLPYPDMGPHEVSEKIHTGYRMSQPPHCSGDIYNLMLMCWAQSPDNRPSLGDIMQNLAHLAENADAHINIDKLPEGLKSSDIVENSNAVA